MNDGQVILRKNIQWDDGQPNGEDLQCCVSIRLKPLRYYDDNCSVKNQFICSWNSKPVFTLRGLCKNSNIDTSFVLYPYFPINGQVIFYGYRDTKIYFDKLNNSWNVARQSFLDNSSLAVYSPDRFGNQLPIGQNNWLLHENECRGHRTMKLTRVRKEQLRTNE